VIYTEEKLIKFKKDIITQKKWKDHGDKNGRTQTAEYIMELKTYRADSKRKTKNERERII
jgi:hypothetical protein